MKRAEVRSRTLAAAASGFVLVCVMASARADVPPDDDYVETCTPEREARPGETCVLCAATVGATECQDLWGAQGYHLRCSQWGATHRQELWCDGPEAAPIEPAASGVGFLGVGVGEALVIGVVCCLVFVGPLAIVAIVVILTRKKKQQRSGP